MVRIRAEPQIDNKPLFELKIDNIRRMLFVILIRIYISHWLYSQFSMLIILYHIYVTLILIFQLPFELFLFENCESYINGLSPVMPQATVWKTSWHFYQLGPLEKITWNSNSQNALKYYVQNNGHFVSIHIHMFNVCCTKYDHTFITVVLSNHFVHRQRKSCNLIMHWNLHYPFITAVLHLVWL